MIKTICLASAVLGLCILAATAQSEDPANRLRGRWITEGGKGVYDAGPCAAGFCGTIIGVKPHVDSNGKPDASCGVQVLTLTKWNAEKRLWEGQVLDPDSRKRYSASLEIGKDGNPVMRASWGLITFSEKWVKFTGSIGNGCEIK